MKNVYVSCSRIFIIVVVVTIGFACQKVGLYFNFSGNGSADFNTCKIKQISIGSGDGATIYNFSYNTNGDPVSVINNKVGTGNPNMYFKYDRYGRLIEMIRPYVNGAYESWDKYIYNKNGQIAKDSAYAFGAMGTQGPLPANHFGIYIYEYDQLGRVIKETDSLFIGVTFGLASVYNFSYDGKGNLVRPNSKTIYDHKLNFHRTNKVWMFISRDYSINNPFIADTYNEFGLPLAFPPGYTDYNILAPNLYSGSNNEIIYDCY